MLLALLTLLTLAHAWKAPQVPVNIHDGPFLEETPHCSPEELQTILGELGHAGAEVDLSQHKVSFSFVDATGSSVPVHIFVRRETLSITAKYRTTVHDFSEVMHVANEVIANCTQRTNEWNELMIMSAAYCTATHAAQPSPQLRLVETLQSDILLPATMYTSRKESNAEEHFKLVKRWLECFTASLQAYSEFRHHGALPFSRPVDLPHAIKAKRVGDAYARWVPTLALEYPALAALLLAGLWLAPWVLYVRKGAASLKSS